MYVYFLELGVLKYVFWFLVMLLVNVIGLEIYSYFLNCGKDFISRVLYLYNFIRERYFKIKMF